MTRLFLLTLTKFAYFVPSSVFLQMDLLLKLHAHKDDSLQLSALWFALHCQLHAAVRRTPLCLMGTADKLPGILACPLTPGKIR
jgi:hypothetical protein